MLKLEDVEGVPFKIDPSATPWLFTVHGDYGNNVVTVHGHDGTLLGHFFGPQARDNAQHFSAMVRVCSGITPELLAQMPAIREHSCAYCGHQVYGAQIYGSLVKEPAAQEAPQPSHA